MYGGTRMCSSSRYKPPANESDATNSCVKNQGSLLNGLSPSANDTWGGSEESSITPRDDARPMHIIGGLILWPFQEPGPTRYTDVTPSPLKFPAISFSRFS